MTAAPAALDPVALTQALVRCPSVTPADAGALDVLRDALEPLGFVCHRLRFEEEGTAPVDNLYARLGTRGPNLCFAGHTDVVPPGPREAWSSDPFVPQIRDGMLYGRGAADMKSGVAAFVVAAERFVAAHPDHTGTLAVLLTSDEEGDAIDGVRRVARTFQERGTRIDWCITGEPSSTMVLGDLLRVGRRGSLSATLTVRGVQGHVAYPQLARNPVHEAMPLLAELTARTWDDGYESFPPTSLQISNIAAGTGATNVIPGVATVQFNLRYTPHWDAPKLEAEIAAMLDRHGLDYTLAWHRSGEPFYTPEGPLRAAARDVLTAFAGAPPEESTGGGTSDARFIAPLGAQCIEVGPVNATIHQVNECVAVDDLERLPELYRQLIERLLD